MKNIIASYMKRTASLEDNILEYLENTSDSELFDITMTINHYSGEFDFMDVMDMSDLEESVSDMSPIDLINMGKMDLIQAINGIVIMVINMNL